MTPKRFHVFLQDEAPRIGSGWRILTVLKGRKWARLLDARSQRRAKLKIALWRELEKWATELPTRKTRRKSRTIIDARTGEPVTKATVAERFEPLKSD